MGNLSFKTKTQCCIDSSNFNEEEDENILEESSCNTNKEEIIIKKNGAVKCDCGFTYTNANKARHFKSKRHLDAFN